MATLRLSPSAAARCADVAVCRTGPFSSGVTALACEAMARPSPGAPPAASLLTDTAGLRQGGGGGHATAAGGEPSGCGGCFAGASPLLISLPLNHRRQLRCSALDQFQGPCAIKGPLGSRALKGPSATSRFKASDVEGMRRTGAFQLRALGGSEGPSWQRHPSVDPAFPSGGPAGGFGSSGGPLRDRPMRWGASTPALGGASSVAGLVESPTCLAASVPSSIQSSMAKAFSSMVLMLKALQAYALQMRSMLYYEDFETVAHSIHREMQASFLWLFQQVFSGTPCLMVAVMLLFSDFTVHSATSNIALQAAALEEQQAPSAVPASTGVGLGFTQTASAAGAEPGTGAPAPGLDSARDEAASAAAPFDTNTGGDRGGDGGRGGLVASAFDEGEGASGSLGGQEAGKGALAPRPRPLEEDDFISMLSCEGAHGASDNSNPALVQLLESTVQEMGLKEGEPVVHLRLDQDVVRRLTAPVSIRLAEDNYACFDCTELQYQLAIQKDPHNPMLLSNFAQFLFIVRRAYDRSELYFHRALRNDPQDGDTLGRYAIFLWLARRDRDGAERAYKAAMAADPENPYHTGSYAHFLWHSGDDEVSCPVA